MQKNNTQTKETEFSCHMGSLPGTKTWLASNIQGCGCPLLLLQSCSCLAAGVGIMKNAKQQNDAMLNGRRNKHAKLWVFSEMAKWR